MGGHAASLLEQHHGALEMYMGIDQDPEALAMAGRRLEKFNPKVKLVRGNFAEMKSIASANGLEERSIDGILLDIGTSSLQLDDAARGFSFMRDGPLDMRMDPNGLLTAADIVNNWSEEAIAEVIYQYGEERKSRSIAKKIVTARTEKPISTTLVLCLAYPPHVSPPCQQLCKIIGGPRFSKGIHPSTLTFQALRIAVNRELHVLTHVLPQAMDLLAPGGRLAVISFHSLEDRIVKQTFRDSGSFRLVTKRPITATTEETKKNPRSRSAKLRIVEKL
ncbi:hypothetical protein GUITHDRAFT_85227 [Guillardia theta CCMP2712]|uniref:Uncharacterized protein n=1 Tax=Guillardia theta (strain CCMP2712) TaxID=905079 RepID=L1JRY1_GUITC|nr:hypothetical protein GUITHDRAFT_85227 [Guillardia theta CCMP2712]EKX50828.1 hypothetical protein GUITHDRAFT_85227 [Guillardia theta CCMP2712]|eukprot:XP_005837808.1 hypothetical protein GUITHDRAFT_85227 [Guillardia theta CCMP2712]